jgi:hypothetical protein
MARAPRPRDPERPAPTNDARRSMMIGVGVGSQYSQVKYIYIYIYIYIYGDAVEPRSVRLGITMLMIGQ